MSKTKLLVAAGLALLAVTCEKVPMTAPAGTLMFLQCNPPFVVANGGTSVISALLTEPAGTLVPDGTVVFFLTTLGRVDSQAKTRDGVARVNFVADSRSGTATVNAWSGGDAPAPAPSTSPTPAATGSVSASVHVGTVAAGDVANDATDSGTGHATITITIGSALPKKVVVTANPPFLANSRQSTITANVFDEFGNPVQNVPVIFTLAAGAGDATIGSPPLQEALASGGSPQYTDSNGQAFDTLTTRAPAGTTHSKTVKVTATPPTGTDSDPLEVTIYYSTLVR